MCLGIALFTTIVCCAERADAEVPSSIVLDRVSDVRFKPAEAFFIVSFDGNSFEKHRALIVPPQDEDSFAFGTYRFGAAVRVPSGSSTVWYGVLLRGKQNRFGFLPLEKLDLAEPEAFAGSVDVLRTHLEQRKQALASWRMQLDVQEETLSRLRKDAEVIGNFGRIADAAEEMERLKHETENLERDINHLRDYLREASSAPAPSNFVRRERALTSQLTELAEVARAVEEGERSRKNVTDIEMRKQIALVENTRYEDYDQLRAELERVRTLRLRLEAKLGGPKTGGDYAVPTPAPDQGSPASEENAREG